MVKIRLMRIGSKKNPHYRVVVVDERRKRTGGYIESIGHYDPSKKTAEPLVIDAERATDWLSKGAQPTSRVLQLLEQLEIPVGKVLVKRGKNYKERQAAASA